MPGLLLKTIEIKNYLGVDSTGIKIELGNVYTVLCGPNNSGKTVIAKSITTISKFLKANPTVKYNRGLNQLTIIPETNNRSAIIEEDDYNFNSNSISFTFVFKIPKTNPIFEGTILGAPNVVSSYIGSVEAEFSITIPKNDNPSYVIKLIDYNQIPPEHHETLLILIYSSVKDFLIESVYFPPNRAIIPNRTQNFSENIDELLSGLGLVEWIGQVKDHDTNDVELKRRNKILKDATREFNEFLELGALDFSVHNTSRKLSLNLKSLQAEKISLNKLGTGLQDVLIILLLTKLFAITKPSDYLLVIEEPELHLHPKLQKKLIEKLVEYNKQIIITTHSPTIINTSISFSSKLIKTFLNKTDRTVGVVERQPRLENWG